jgi:hypothetical protein
VVAASEAVALEAAEMAAAMITAVMAAAEMPAAVIVGTVLSLPGMRVDDPPGVGAYADQPGLAIARSPRRRLSGTVRTCAQAPPMSS